MEYLELEMVKHCSMISTHANRLFLQALKLNFLTYNCGKKPWKKWFLGYQLRSKEISVLRVDTLLKYEERVKMHIQSMMSNDHFHVVHAYTDIHTIHASLTTLQDEIPSVA